LFGIAVIVNTPIPGQILPADLLGGIRGGIIADFDFKMAVILGQESFQGLGEKFFAVINRQADTHQILFLGH
jgi:hypothetical protein